MVCVLITVIGVCIKDNMVEIGPETSTRTFTIETTTTTEETASTTITTSTTETTTSTSTTELTTTTTTTTAPDIQNTNSPLYATYFEDAHLSQTEAIQVVVPTTTLTYSPRPQTTHTTTTIQMKTEPPHIENVEVAQTTQTEAITNANWHFIGTFKGTYYLPTGRQRPGNTCGGSTRLLEDCGRDNEYGIRGSVACKKIYTEYGYDLNGRTIILIQSQSMPALNGYYYVDDCCRDMNVVDFYFDYASNCPFQNQGVVRDISVSVMP